MPHVEPIAREALEEYESFPQIAEQMMGGSMSTELEDVPRAHAERHLGASGWHVGKHR